MVGTKPGWKTSEFWLTVVTNLIGILGMEKGSVPAQYQPYVIAALTVLNAVYTVARTFIKQTDSTVTTTSDSPATVTTTSVSR